MTIHSGHPFLEPESERSSSRRLRGRLGGAVTLWATGTGAGAERAGLTVSSLMLADGEPARLLALVDPDSDFAERLDQTGVAAVTLLSWPDRDLAEMFAGTAPAPGGRFAQAGFVDTDWGPRLASAVSWVGVRREEGRELGWSQLLTCLIEQVSIGEDTQPLLHRRGRYLTI